MTPRSLFMIILKCLGVFVIKDVLVMIPILFSTFASFLDISQRDPLPEAILIIFLSVFSIGIYFLAAYFLIFKSGRIIDKLKLDKGFEEENFSFNIHRSSILSIIIVITGLLIIVDAIPVLCRGLMTYFQEKTFSKLLDRTGFKNVIIPSIQIILCLLIVGNQQQIVNFIERKRRNTVIENEQI